MKSAIIAALVAVVAAAPGGEWQAWSSSSVCPTSTVYTTEYATETAYVTKEYPTTVYQTEYKTEYATEYKTETDYVTETKAYPTTVYTTEYETYTQPCATSSK